MRIELRSPATPDLAAISQSFWSHGSTSSAADAMPETLRINAAKTNTKMRMRNLQKRKICGKLHYSCFPGDTVPRI
jgi:hypothetical protein